MTETMIARSAEVHEGAVLALKTGGHSLMLTRVDGDVRVFENRCPHLGLPLARGRIEDGAIRCPFHGSRFDLCDGANRDWVNALGGLPLPVWSRGLVALGRVPTGLRRYEAGERDGLIYAEL